MCEDNAKEQDNAAENVWHVSRVRSPGPKMSSGRSMEAQYDAAARLLLSGQGSLLTADRGATSGSGGGHMLGMLRLRGLRSGSGGEASSSSGRRGCCRGALLLCLLLLLLLCWIRPRHLPRASDSTPPNLIEHTARFHMRTLEETSHPMTTLEVQHDTVGATVGPRFT